MVKRLDWSDLASGGADSADGAVVELDGWVAPLEIADRHAYFLLAPEPICCLGCLPTNSAAAVEVFAAAPVAAQGRPVRLRGRWRRLIDDPAGWRYQMREAVAAELPPARARVTRREVMAAAGASLALAPLASGSARAQLTPQSSDQLPRARELIAKTLSIDIHSHAGRIIRSNAPLGGVAAPMREGGLSVAVLAMVADVPVTRVIDNRISAVRTPNPGELYGWSETAFARIRILAESEQLPIVTDTASLRAAQGKGPAVVVAAEGADFLEGLLSRLEDAYRNHRLRHLQLTHYRVNELGDIQTEPPQHGGLTDFGAEVVRACNRLGIVVDVAHGTYDLVKRVAQVSSKPLVLSHTSLANTRTGFPSPLSRTISPDHARAVAATGGVIGIWPPTTIFADKGAFAAGVARMADVVGIDHVGIGSDMLGLLSPSAFGDYRELPELTAALLAFGFAPADAAKILGGNYARVFAASMA